MKLHKLSVFQCCGRPAGYIGVWECGSGDEESLLVP